MANRHRSLQIDAHLPSSPYSACAAWFQFGAFIQIRCNVKTTCYSSYSRPILQVIRPKTGQRVVAGAAFDLLPTCYLLLHARRGSTCALPVTVMTVERI